MVADVMSVSFMQGLGSLETHSFCWFCRKSNDYLRWEHVLLAQHATSALTMKYIIYEMCLPYSMFSCQSPFTLNPLDMLFVRVELHERIVAWEDGSRAD